MKTFVVICFFVAAAFACTNFLVTPEASADGSAMISYAADSAALFGALYNNVHAKHQAGEKVQIYDWDTGHYLGEIDQVEETYTTIGNTNEYGLAIGETTYGGVEALQEQKDGIVDYGSLIYLALQRAKTAREAIQVMTDLVAKYGYASEGESFSIADKNEVWVMEMIGKGNYELGAVWVAVRVPAGHITAHANQARIRQFPLNDPDNCVYSKDVIQFAKNHGFYSGPDEEFSFSDVYNPVEFEGARMCEMRAWSFFRKTIGADAMKPYEDYVAGKNLSNRMPWSFPVKTKLTLENMTDLMRDHLEDTPFDFRYDVGAGPYNHPYRWRPMTFEVDGKTYLNERSTGTQQTAWVFVAQLRQNMPDALTAVNWFGLDDAACTVFTPFYTCSTKVPDAYAAEGNGAIMDFKITSAFWVFNLVSQMTYERWRIIYPELYAMATKMQKNYADDLKKTDQELLALSKAGKTEEMIARATNITVERGKSTYDQWLQFWEYLVPRYVDGNTKTPVPGEKNPQVDWPGYGDAWYKRIVQDTGDHYLVPDTSRLASANPRLRVRFPSNKV